jgi:drug/metabolite transporter (DMT)-like permease
VDLQGNCVVTNALWRPYIVLAVGLLAVSSSSILIRFAQNEHAPSLLISAWRVAVATIALTPIVFTIYRTEVMRLTRRDILLSLAAGFMLSIHFASWITSLEYTSVINSSVLVSTNPLWIAIASPFILKEKLSRVTIGAIFIALIGVVVVSLAGSAGSAPKQGDPMLGNFLAVVGAIAVSGYYLIGRRVRARVSVISYIWLTYGASAIFLFIIVLVTGQQVTGLSTNAYFWMTMIGLIPQLIGHSAYNYALGYLSAAYVSLTLLAEPIGSTILARLLLSESPMPLQVIGGALILLALIIASREETRSTRQAKLVQDAEIETAATL